MKALKYGFGLVLIAGLALNASCGGSSSDNSDGTAGTSSTTAGESSTAGDGSSTAGSGNTTAGGNSVGGDISASGGDTMTDQGGAPASGGGAAGRGGMGRAGAANGGAPASGGAAATNPMDCPMASLAENAMCTPLATTMERCKYGDESCRCVVPAVRGPGNDNGGAGGTGGAPAAAAGRWTCAAVCPTDKPTVGTDCTQGLACPFTGGGCVCGQSKKWQCTGGGMMGGGGNNGTTCPMQKPRAGGMCMGTGACTYANRTGCACVGDKWLCD
ncbi:MAG TPA: hypothetical protein VHW01_20335 [Polyangiaceae bacterium]|nr:hypothetical protein [Polyangiaceae bacterium]